MTDFRASPVSGPATPTPQYVVEGIILRRLYEQRIEGYTIETAKEIVEALAKSDHAQRPDLWPSDGQMLNILIASGYDADQVHPHCYRGFGWKTFTEKLRAAVSPDSHSKQIARANEHVTI